MEDAITEVIQAVEDELVPLIQHHDANVSGMAEKVREAFEYVKVEVDELRSKLDAKPAPAPAEPAPAAPAPVDGEPETIHPTA